jgi:hypothetical protein
MSLQVHIIKETYESYSSKSTSTTPVQTAYKDNHLGKGYFEQVAVLKSYMFQQVLRNPGRANWASLWSI